MNKNLIELLINIKNASLAKKSLIKFAYKASFIDYLSILYKEGFIQSYSISFDITKKEKIFLISLRLFESKVLTENLKLISLPSRSKTLSYEDITQLNIKNKLIVLSTSKGIMSHVECLKRKTGGTAIFSC